jgi:hypothetical protein
MMKFIDEVALRIIRPKRFYYHPSQLDSEALTRTDFTVHNAENQRLECSLYSRQPLEEVAELVVYLHCNSGCRLEGLELLGLAKEFGVGLLVFDFAGSGLS